MTDPRFTRKTNYTQLLRYAGMATQLAAGLLLTAWLGKWIDGRTGTARAVWIWILPLLLLGGTLAAIIRGTRR